MGSEGFRSGAKVWRKPDPRMIGMIVTSLNDGVHGRVVAVAQCGVYIDPQYGAYQNAPLCVRARFVSLP